MNALLLKITPTIQKRIASHTQHWIFRRVGPRQGFARIILTLENPEPHIIIECIPGHIYELDIKILQHLAFATSGMTKYEWIAYWSEKQIGTAIPILDMAVVPPEMRINPIKYWGLKELPENFCYVPKPKWPLGRPNINPEEKAGTLFEKQ